MKAPFPTVGAWRRRKDIFTNHDLLTYLITELINDEAVCRTAPATPGLLNTERNPLLTFLRDPVQLFPKISSITFTLILYG